MQSFDFIEMVNTMANLVVRNVDESVAKALKVQAGKQGISAEALHRRILETVLIKPQKKTFAEVLQQMPNVGEDSDFERIDDSGNPRVFD